MRNDSPPKGIPIRTKGQKGARTSTPLNVPVGALSPSVNVGKPSMPINSSEIVNLSTIDTSSQSGLPKVEVTDLRSSTHFEFNKNQKAVETQAEEEVTLQLSSSDAASVEKGKRKTPPLTMGEFIHQAYSRKGQRVGLKPNQEKSLSVNHKLDQEAFGRLLDLAKQDRLLQVPRQLLLTARKIQSYPLPKKVLIEFVHAVLKAHPIFKVEHLRTVLEDDKQLPPLYSLYQSIKSYNPPFKITDEHLEREDLEKLKINTLNLMTAWLFYERNVRIDEIVAVLLQVIWKPAAEKLETDSQVIRALTELDELEAIGWVAERYLKNVVDAQDSEKRAHNEAVNYRSEANSLRVSLDLEIEKSKNLKEQLDSLKLASEETVGALHRTNQETKTHLAYDIEIMRGRLIENLRISIDRLQTGLTALNREVPRIEVMTERAELVIESLQSELKELDGEV